MVYFTLFDDHQAVNLIQGNFIGWFGLTHSSPPARIAPLFSPYSGDFLVYAVIATGGKQYLVHKGDQIKVEKLGLDPGKKVEFDQVLLLADGEDVSIGTPYVKGGKVTAEVQDNSRAKKVEVIKFKRRKNYMKRMGHRQHYTQVKITDISK